MSNPQPRELMHFVLLSEAEQHEAIRKMAQNNWSVRGISDATRKPLAEIVGILAKVE